MTASRPPWREPMLWLVVGLPAAVVIAGMALSMRWKAPGGRAR